MRFHIITIFPEAFSSYFNTSIIKRAQKQKLIQINLWNLRQWTNNHHQTVDDHPYGGGAGMIFMIEPIFKALKSLTKNKKIKRRVILFSVNGKKFTQKDAERLKKYREIIFICPHYEGVDARVKKLVDEEISIGDYILTGGELPAMVVIDAITRLIPGVIRKESLLEESFSLGQKEDATYEYPQYTRPEIFYPYPKNKKIVWKVPKVLLSGDHQKIKEWREKHVIVKTQSSKPRTQN
ncbi:MAG: tRNA (guanosine(37)-N1)-methyltransferase TrmD [Parcubacteria group bacterium]|nr:tRNA (guanosine(37)-N1)-methyltransferase TrmD [Parcubacteria group bacterium]